MRTHLARAVLLSVCPLALVGMTTCAPPPRAEALARVALPSGQTLKTTVVET